MPGPVTIPEIYASQRELLTPPVLLPDCFELTVTSVKQADNRRGPDYKQVAAAAIGLYSATRVPMHSPDCGTHVLTPLESIVQLDWH